MTEFEDIVDVVGLDPAEEDRLRRVHELLVAAGPPPELPAGLERPADPHTAQPPEVPVLFRRRRMVGALALLAAALAAFGGGYLAGHSHAKQAAFVAERDVPMHGSAGGSAVIHIAKEDSVGNWPMLVDVNGLPRQQARDAYYELWLTKDGKPAVPCGSFRVHGQTTTVRLSVPYSFRGYDGWVVTAQPNDRKVGPVVLTT
jgi:anti-sigma-K factor RskA